MRCGRLRHSAEIRPGTPAWSRRALAIGDLPQMAPAVLSPDGPRQSDAIRRCTISQVV
jgi:hypothetical protein